MTSLIERLRAVRRSWGDPKKWDPFKAATSCDEAATALEQARNLIMKSRPAILVDKTNWYDGAEAWLRLIDGEQEKEG